MALIRLYRHFRRCGCSPRRSLSRAWQAMTRDPLNP
jgi:hypothetical protein